MHSKLNTTKKGSSSYELATIIKATQIFAIVLLTLTISSALTLSKTPSQSTANAESSSVTASVTVENSCTMSGSIETNKAHTATVQSGSYTPDIGETLISVNCNDNNGYSVYAIGFTGNVDGTTTLVGANTNLTIPTGTSTSTASSNWAMKLTPVSGTSAPTILSNANGSFASYHVVPNTATKVATLTSNTESSSSFKTTYAVAIGTSQPADTYSGQVKYTLVHPSNADADGVERNYVITFRTNNAESIVFNGVAYTDGQTLEISTSEAARKKYHIYGNYGTRYAFSSWSKTGGTFENQNYQNTTYTVTSSATITLTGQQVTTAIQNLSASNCTTTARPVYDNRDDSVYWIQKLPDGKCWMLDNMALDLTDSTIVDALSTANTHLDATSLTYFKNGGGTSSDRYPITAYGTFDSTDVYSQPRTNVEGKDITLRPSTATNYTGSFSGAYGLGQGKIGAYYNYCAASVGYYCFGNGTSWGVSSGNSDYDICPAGWRMPTGDSEGEYRSLCSAIKGSECVSSGSGYESMSATSPTSLQTQLSTPLSGHFLSGSARGRGLGGDFWSSTRSSNLYVYILSVGPSTVFPATNYFYYYGNSVRCVLGS